MIKTYFTSLVLVTYHLLVIGQNQVNSLLWKVERENIQPSYIFGTFHILPQKDFVLDESVVSAFNEAELIVLELDTDDPQLQSKVLKEVNMNDGSTIYDYLEESAINLIDSLIQASTHLGVEAFKSWKPAMLSTLIMSHFIEGNPASFEATFTQMAGQNGKEINGIENVSEQLQVFDSIPYQVQADDLMRIISDPENTMTLFDEMISAYNAGNIDSIYQMAIEYIDDPNQIDILLTNRNKKWISRIQEISSGKRVFFGVGAGHLGGETGIINLLIQEGYTLTPIN